MQDFARRKGDSALIAALAGGATVRDAAKTANLNESTVHRRLEDPDFRRAVHGARGALVAQAVGQLADASTEATSTLRALLRADAETVRLGAARSILELGTRLRETEELAARVVALEERQASARQALAQQQQARRWA
jgi:hypothetical protein